MIGWILKFFLGYQMRITLISGLVKPGDQGLISISTILKFSAQDEIHTISSIWIHVFVYNWTIINFTELSFNTFSFITHMPKIKYNKEKAEKNVNRSTRDRNSQIFGIRTEPLTPLDYLTNLSYVSTPTASSPSRIAIQSFPSWSWSWVFH